MTRRIAVTTAALGLAIAGQGCADNAEREVPSIDGQLQELIGGVPANSAALDAIGALGFLSTYEDCYTGETITRFEPFCTGSLISKKTVLTAKHCILDIPAEASEDFVPVFAMGADGNHPSRMIPIVAVDDAPVDVGGFVGLGSDVGIAHLEQAVEDITPLKLGALKDKDIGKRFGVIGYGVQNNQGDFATRMAGAVTINARGGRFYEMVFGDFESFKDWYLGSDYYGASQGMGDGDAVVEDGGVGGDDGSTSGGANGGADSGSMSTGDAGDDDWLDAYLREIYETSTLLEGYEAYVGNQPGDAQPCFGDSGGPLVKANKKGELVVYGVTSGGIGSSRMVCDYGAVYATFPSDVSGFIKQSKKWKDPCRGETTKGSCDGAVATRCTSFGEGERRLTATDCSLFGQTCAIASNEVAMCAAPGEEPVVIDEGDDACDWMGESDAGAPDEDFGAAQRAKIEAVRARNQSIYVGPLEPTR